MSRPIRYTFILGLAALATVFAGVGGWRFARASAPLNGPIIIVSIDSLRADRLPAYGYTGVRTPALDALAADGVVFERAYSHSPSTLPAHAAMLTGRLPFETGVRDNVGFTLKSNERSLAQMLRDRGYTTGGVVSAFALRKSTGIGSGFDFFDSDLRPDAAGATTIGHLKRDGAASEAIAERWLTSIGSSRALLFLHIDEPHKPYVLPDRFGEYAEYDGAVAYSDEIVGRLVRYLKSQQMYDRSTIVVLSDHGEGLGDHGEQQHGLFLYDEAIHVPLIVKQEGNAGAGRRVSAVVQHIDLVPTILELVKTSIPGGLHGRSLKPLLDGTGQVPARPVYSESLYARYQFGWSELVAVTDERYRYVKAPTEELYEVEIVEPVRIKRLSVGRADVIALQEAFEHDLPVCRDLALPRGDQPLLRRDQLRQLIQRPVGQARLVLRDEHQAESLRHADRRQTVKFLVEIWEAVLVGDAAQSAVESVGPAVVRTHEGLGAARTLGRQLRSPVATGVAECSN